jgi:hypothetical protein
MRTDGRQRFIFLEIALVLNLSLVMNISKFYQPPHLLNSMHRTGKAGRACIELQHMEIPVTLLYWRG